MGQLNRSNKHRARVIEIYENGSAAVEFTSGRIEHVLYHGFGPSFYVGMTGTVDYVRSVNGYEWIFTPKMPVFEWECLNPKCYDQNRPLKSEPGGEGELVCDRCGVLMKRGS